MRRRNIPEREWSLIVDFSVQEIHDFTGHQRTIFIQCEMAGIEKVKFDTLQVIQIRVGASFRKDVIVLAPKDDRRGLMLAEERLPERILIHIGPIVIKQVQLDLFGTGAVQKVLVMVPAVPGYGFKVADAVGVLPFGGAHFQDRAQSVTIDG